MLSGVYLNIVPDEVYCENDALHSQRSRIHLICFKNNDGPSNQVHLHGVAEGGENCSDSGLHRDPKFFRHQLFFLACA